MFVIRQAGCARWAQLKVGSIRPFRLDASGASRLERIRSIEIRAAGSGERQAVSPFAAASVLNGLAWAASLYFLERISSWFSVGEERFRRQSWTTPSRHQHRGWSDDIGASHWRKEGFRRIRVKF